MQFTQIYSSSKFESTDQVDSTQLIKLNQLNWTDRVQSTQSEAIKSGSNNYKQLPNVTRKNNP